jgi:hypothetical protein
MKVVPYRFISAIKSRIPWFIPGKSMIAMNIFERLIECELVDAKVCTAYACNGGRCEGLGAGYDCCECKGTGWVSA